MRRMGGFTLWELLCSLGIAAVALTAGVPAFRTFLLDCAAHGRRQRLDPCRTARA